MVARIKDVAKKAEVSTATVSHVINNTRHVSENTKNKVIQAMHDLNYYPNNVARFLRSQKSKIIGFLAPLRDDDTAGQYFLDIAHGIESAISPKDYQLIISNSNENPDVESKQFHLFNTKFADFLDGLIMAPTEKFIENHIEKQFNNYPIIFVDRAPSNTERSHVLTNNYDITCEAINSLIQDGCKNIAFISGPLDVTTSHKRFKAYKDTLKQNKIKYNENLIKTSEASFQSGYSMMQELINNKPDALLISNNTLAMGTMKYINDYDIKFPAKEKIIIYDDYEWTRLATPPLSVIKQPSFDMGKKAAEILLEQIEQQKTECTRHYLKSTLILR